MSFDEELAPVTELNPPSMAKQLMLPWNGQEVILYIYAPVRMPFRIAIVHSSAE